LWQLAVENNIPKIMRERLEKRTAKYQKCGDIFGDVTTQKYASPLNERQLWFLEMLKSGKKMQNKHIATEWNVALRTAKRDTERLLATGEIQSVRKGRMAWFERMAGQDE
jgi:DNA-binding NarL/FixJ family response regulator